jgi:2-polyprenyl-6-methoxyphenol hydroxylase-like FAD-dependent oxidoreductase
VEYSSDGVTVHCENGSSFDGDLVVGADGIHSVVRTAMWRHADKADPSAFSIKDKTSMAAEFKIMFGISKGVEGLPISQDQHIYGKDCGVLLVHSKDNFTYWFMSIKLDKKYVTPNIPRYTKSDAVELAERYLDLKLNEHLTFATVWEKRTIFSLHPAEEYLADRWTWNRFVAIGDAVHKAVILTPWFDCVY